MCNIKCTYGIARTTVDICHLNLYATIRLFSFSPVLCTEFLKWIKGQVSAYHSNLLLFYLLYALTECIDFKAVGVSLHFKIQPSKIQ